MNIENILLVIGSIVIGLMVVSAIHAFFTNEEP